jgi:hypothetical protein
MKAALMVAIALSLIALFPAGFPLAQEKGRALVVYPEDYREWTHVKSMVIQEGHPLFTTFGGIHHVYANMKALQSMKEGNAYPDNSVFVLDLLAAEMIGKGIREGPRKLVAVMWKESERFSETGGWGFEAFMGDTRQRLVKDPVTDCFRCHKPRTESDHVFSRRRK